jgi:hypothetical protein
MLIADMFLPQGLFVFFVYSTACSQMAYYHFFRIELLNIIKKYNNITISELAGNLRVSPLFLKSFQMRPF